MTMYPGQPQAKSIISGHHGTVTTTPVGCRTVRALLPSRKASAARRAAARDGEAPFPLEASTLCRSPLCNTHLHVQPAAHTQRPRDRNLGLASRQVTKVWQARRARQPWHSTQQVSAAGVPQATRSAFFSAACNARRKRCTCHELGSPPGSLALRLAVVGVCSLPCCGGVGGRATVR